MSRNESRAAPGTGSALRDQADTNRTDPRSRPTIPASVLLTVVYRVAARANQIEAEQRDRECHCPGRAFVAHAWEIGSHKDECRAGYAWVSVDDAAHFLRRRVSRSKIAALSLAIGGAT